MRFDCGGGGARAVGARAGHAPGRAGARAHIPTPPSLPPPHRHRHHHHAQVLDITDDDLGDLVTAGVRNVAALCLAIGYPTLASRPHSIVNGYKNVLAIALETDYTFPYAEKVGVGVVGVC